MPPLFATTSNHQLLQFGRRPLMVAAVNMFPGAGSAATADRKQLSAAVSGACRELQGRHQGLTGLMWMAAAGTFNCKPEGWVGGGSRGSSPS